MALMSRFSYSYSLILRVEPALYGGDFILADDDLLVGSSSHVDTHLAKEIGGEFLHGGSANDKLTVDAHKALGVELGFYFFKGHVQRVVFPFHCTTSRATT